MPARLTPRDYSKEAIALAESRQAAAFEALRLEGEALDTTVARLTPQTEMDDLDDVRTWDVVRLISPVQFSKYEDQDRFPLYQLLFQIGIAQILAEESEPEAWPMLVTLPSGSLDAYTERDPIDECDLIFLERGLLDFVVNAGRLVSWLLPEGFVTVVAGQHTASMEARALLHSLVFTYAVGGTPDPGVEFPTKDLGFAPLRKLLAPRAIAFLLMHELAHVRYRHIHTAAATAAKSVSREFQADKAAFIGTLSASQPDERQWGMPFYVADTFLCALNALVLTLSRLWHGNWNRVWSSTTHPPPWERRGRLKDVALAHLPDEQAAMVASLYEMNSSVWAGVMESVQLSIEFSLKQNPQRLHPIWHAYARSSFGEQKG